MARILVIDDCKETCEAVAAMMKQEGHEVMTAADGLDGAQIYRFNEVDLIITDIVMPRRDGIQTIVDLWQDYPDMKVIAISGGSDEADPEPLLDGARLFGAIRTFKKPFSRKDLVSTVNELLAD